ncbi:MAG: proteasome subunit beta [Candidatus Woesearchaeota archaeon]
MSNEDMLKTGTTTVGILSKDSVILAADKRATAGNFIADKNVKKVMKITDNIALTIAGSVADIQLLVKLLRAELKLKELRNSRKPTVKEAATLLAGMQYRQLRYAHGIGHFVVGGYDEKERLFDVFPDGSIMDISETGFVASGSGSTYAYGLIEDMYKKDISKEEAIDLATRSIHSAMKRDSASGQGIDIMVITKDGINEVPTKRMNENLS